MDRDGEVSGFFWGKGSTEGFLWGAWVGDFDGCGSGAVYGGAWDGVADLQVEIGAFAAEFVGERAVEVGEVVL